MEIRKIGSFGSEADTLTLGATSWLVQLSDGRFVAAPTSRDNQAVVFDSSGAMAKPFGRAGEGPGESGRILNAFAWRGDSALLVEWNRLTFLGGLRGTGRTETFETPTASWRAVPLMDDSMVVINYVYPPHAEYAVLDSKGRIRAEMGHVWSGGRFGDGYQSHNPVGPSSQAHSFWSGKERYKIELTEFDALTGVVRTHLNYDRPWYTKYDSVGLFRFLAQGGDAVALPPPFMRGLREGKDLRIWTLYTLPAQDWRPVPANRVAKGSVKYDRNAYDGLIEVVDRATGQSIIAARLSLPLVGFIDDTLMIDRRETKDGFWVIDLYKVVLRP